MQPTRSKGEGKEGKLIEEVDITHSWTPGTQKAKAEGARVESCSQLCSQTLSPPSKKRWAGGMVQWLRALAAFAEVLGVIPSPSSRGSNGFLYPSSLDTYLKLDP